MIRQHGRRRKAEGGVSSQRSRCAPNLFSVPPSSPRLVSPRLGVTLVELLITITIIAVLSAVFLGVSNAAMENARASRTKSTISKIHSLLMEKWTSYATRRVDVDPDLISDLRTAFGTNQRAIGQARSDLRLLAVREMMLLEMPDSWSDILQAPVGSTPGIEPRVLGAFPALRSTYLRRYEALTADDATIEEHQGAECLYMIIMLSTGDGEARTLFSEQDIGDTDGDGAPEFLDGWGRPIHFIRWPAGFAARSDLMLGDAAKDHDPIDIFRRDQFVASPATRPPISDYPSSPGFVRVMVSELADISPAFRLLPLVYSAGPDGISDIDDEPYLGGAAITSLDPFSIDPDPPSSPTIFGPAPLNYVFGYPRDMNLDGDDNSVDNIHNHLQDNR